MGIRDSPTAVSTDPQDPLLVVLVKAIYPDVPVDILNSISVRCTQLDKTVGYESDKNVIIERYYSLPVG